MSIEERQMLDQMMKQTLDEWMQICAAEDPDHPDLAWRLIPGVGYLKIISRYGRPAFMTRTQPGSSEFCRRSLYNSAQYRSRAILLNIGIPGDGNRCLLTLDELLAIKRNIRGATR